MTVRRPGLLVLPACVPTLCGCNGALVYGGVAGASVAVFGKGLLEWASRP